MIKSVCHRSADGRIRTDILLTQRRKVTKMQRSAGRASAISTIFNWFLYKLCGSAPLRYISLSLLFVKCYILGSRIHENDLLTKLRYNCNDSRLRGWRSAGECPA